MIELFSIPVEQAILSTVIGTEQGMDEYIEQIDSVISMQLNTKLFGLM